MKSSAATCIVAERQREAVAISAQRLEIELFLLVRGHARLARAAHAIALLGLGQDHGGLAAVGARRGERRIQLAHVVTAAAQGVDLGQRHVRDQCLQLRIELEEVRLVVGAIVGAQRLILAVGGFGKTPQQRMMGIAREQRVPVRSPQHLDDVPARTREQPLEFLDDLAVAAHRPVEALQVAVDDES